MLKSGFDFWGLFLLGVSLVGWSSGLYWLGLFLGWQMPSSRVDFSFIWLLFLGQIQGMSSWSLLTFESAEC